MEAGSPYPYFMGHLLSPEEQNMKAMIINSIRNLYERGVPLYTKLELKLVADQMALYAEGRLPNKTLAVTDLNGRVVQMPVDDSISVFNTPGGTRLKLDEKPTISYRTIQDLTDEAHSISWNPQNAFLPLNLVFHYHPVDSAGRNLRLSCHFSVPVLSEIFANAKKEWESTTHYAALKGLFATHANLHKARKVVGFALGELVWGNQYGRGHDYSLTQYALLLSLRELVMEHSGNVDVPCVAQDPALSTNAITALNNAGIGVAEDPYGFLEVDDLTIVVSISPNIPIKQIITEIARPVGIIWIPGSIEEEGNSPITDPTSARVEAMLDQEYVELGFPGCELLREAEFYMKNYVES
ncbi:hypothetical protein F4777DRAFT_600513 [Nemania sp. FL0916]|nr:hypothetical protein F4777DRAFT_600513 [Nemania sp. FL0916]